MLYQLVRCRPSPLEMADLSLSTFVVAIHTAPTGVLQETHCQPCYLARASRSLQPGLAPTYEAFRVIEISEIGDRV
jgi:hypothetical protein